MKKKIFISHISDEADLARAIRERLEGDFLGLIDAFVSSDTDSISAGSNWLKSVEEALKTCKVLLVLCSPQSVGRPWINFEAGVAWARKLPIVPLCHSGLEVQALPMPLSILQAAKASDPDGVKRVYKLVADTIGCKVPRGGIADFVSAVTAFEAGENVSSDLGGAKPRMRGLHEMGKREAHIAPEVDRQSAAIRRIKEALAEPNPRFRSVDRLATLAGITEEEVLDLLRSDPEVVFGKSKKTGKRIVRLQSR